MQLKIQKTIEMDIIKGKRTRMLNFLLFINKSFRLSGKKISRKKVLLVIFPSKFSVFYRRDTTVLFKYIAKVIWFGVSDHCSDDMAFVVGHFQ